MSSKFAKDWVEAERAGIKEAIRPSKPLKPRLNQAIRRVESQVQRLQQAGDRLSERDKTIFAKIVEAYTSHDKERANVFANELSEIRKMEKFMMHASLALERVVLRLKTVSELGDIVVTLAPATNVLESVRRGVSGILPSAERELGQVGTMLSEIIVEAGQTTGMTLNFDVANEDAKRIMNEAAMVAEQRMKDKFPDLPAGISAAEKTTAQTEGQSSFRY